MSQSLRIAAGFLGIALSGQACTAPSGANDQPDAGGPCTDCPVPDAGTVCAPGTPTADRDGAYDAVGSWDLSAPVSADRGLGDLVTDLLIEEAIGLLGVPGALADEARDELEDRIGSLIRDRVNGSAPDEFVRQDPFIADLIAVTGEVGAVSTIELEAAADAATVIGVEELHTFRIEYRGVSHDIDPKTLVGGLPGVPVVADWTGTAAGARLSVDDHAFSLRYGQLVLEIVSEVLGTDAFAAFQARIATAIDCPGLVASIVGDDGELEISIGITSFDVDAAPLVSACNAGVTELLDSAFGLFDVDSGIVVGGDVLAIDDDCDGVTDRLRSEPGYGGVVAVVGPSALAPRVAVELEATRSARRAFADMRNTVGSASAIPIRGRLVWEYDDVDRTTAVPYRELFQDEIRGEPVELTVTSTASPVSLGALTTDGDGNVDASIAIIGIAPGLHTIEVRHAGDVAGTFTVRVLGASHAEPVVRSDIDLTYLESDFHSATGLIGLLTSSARDRVTVAGMETVYAQITRTAGPRFPVTFLSGSPTFFSRVMEGRAEVDGFHQDGVILKPFEDIVVSNLLALTVDDVVPELEEQIGYKLHALLRLRLEIPGTTPEILLGDDSEADHIVYSLYSRFVSGELSQSALTAALVSHGVVADWRTAIAPLLAQVRAHVTTGLVVAVYIRATPVPSAVPVDDHRTPLFRHHDGAWPLALDFFEQGWFDAAQVQAVRTQLLARGATSASLLAAANAGVADGFLDPATVAAF